MDFDLSKENIQPLRGGRNAAQLEMALQAQTNQEFQRRLQQQREEFENLIRTYHGDDPLEHWYHYVSWVEQSYPKHGHEGNLANLLELCLRKFENDTRYTNDRRFCKLWIKYIDMQTNPLELFHMMYARGLCRGCADLYKAWAYYFEAVSDFQQANNVFECGKKELAQPYEELEFAHKNLIMAAGQHLLYGTDERRLVEKRQVLTSLHTFKPGRVGSVRIPSASGGAPFVLPNGGSGGTAIGTAIGGQSSSNSNAAISIYQDAGDAEAGGSTLGAAAPPISILTAAKRQEVPKENTLKPGPWTTVPMKKRHTTQQRAAPSFTVHEDDADDAAPGPSTSTARPNPDTPAPDPALGAPDPALAAPAAQADPPLVFPEDSKEPLNDWKLSLTLPEPQDDRMIPMYPKARVYAQHADNVEYSIEELRASRYPRVQVVRNNSNNSNHGNSPFNNDNNNNHGNSSSVNKKRKVPADQCEVIAGRQAASCSFASSATGAVACDGSGGGDVASNRGAAREDDKSKVIPTFEIFEDEQEAMDHSAIKLKDEPSTSHQALNRSLQRKQPFGAAFEATSTSSFTTLANNISLANAAAVAQQQQMQQQLNPVNFADIHNSNSSGGGSSSGSSHTNNTSLRHQSSALGAIPISAMATTTTNITPPAQGVLKKPTPPHQQQHHRGFTKVSPVISLIDDDEDDDVVELKQEKKDISFNVWDSPTPSPVMVAPPKPPVQKFSIYEQSNLGLKEHIEPKGSAMKTPFKDLNAEDLCETGSRGGMAIAAAAPVDGAKRLPMMYCDGDDDNSSSPYGKAKGGTTFADLSCNTQMFNFNLNAMQVSTPQTKQQQQQLKQLHQQQQQQQINNFGTRKQLFGETTTAATTSTPPNIESEKVEKALSIIMEETKSYSSSSSTNNGTTKSSIASTTAASTAAHHQTKQITMATISEEHNSYLAQNLLANAALRSSLLGDLMDFDARQARPSVDVVTSRDAPMATDSVAGAAAEAVPMITSTPGSPVHYIEDDDDEDDDAAESDNDDDDVIPPPTSVSPLKTVPSDPFKPALINQLLEKVSFPGQHTRGYYLINNTPRFSVRKEAMTIGADRYIIEKQLGKGTYGTVFRGLDLKTGNVVALKFQRPAHKWEFYLCRELQSRLADHPLRDRFMDVRIGYFSDQASVLISEFMRCGSLLDVANTVKQKTGRSMKESLCIHFCIEMLKVVQAMHGVKIIHADIKPDNFLVRLLPDGGVSLQLIDFGCSIDMTLFPEGATFKRRVTTEDFVCCEMRDGRPWNYHTDMYCIAATAHVLLFEKYMQTQKKDGHWSITHRLPRYLRLDLWNTFFCAMLNQGAQVADSTNLQNLMSDSLRTKYDDYQNELRFLLNILQNR